MRDNSQGSLKDKCQHEIHAMPVLRVAWRPALHLCCLLILVLTGKTFGFCMDLPPCNDFCRIQDRVWWLIAASLLSIAEMSPLCLVTKKKSHILTLFWKIIL